MKAKAKSGALLGAAFLMATSAIGPGFLTQTAKFTGDFQASFGFVILISVILSAIAQLNIWRVLCVSGMRGQDVGNRLLPGLGYFISFLIVLGGLVFNIGNVGGGALGIQTTLGIPVQISYFIAGGLAVLVFLSKDAKGIMDKLVKILGGIMIVVILVVIFIVKPPVATAVKNSFVPDAGLGTLVPAILTLLGGTVGGYITFAGAHRLIDAGVTGEDCSYSFIPCGAWCSGKRGDFRRGKSCSGCFLPGGRRNRKTLLRTGAYLCGYYVHHRCGLYFCQFLKDLLFEDSGEGKSLDYRLYRDFHFGYGIPRKAGNSPCFGGSFKRIDLTGNPWCMSCGFTE